MSFRRFGGRRSFGRKGRMRPVIDSNKNIVSAFTALAAGVKNNVTIAEAQDSATLAVTQDVERGCAIRAVWVEFWITSTALVSEGVTTGVDLYFWKNSGSNLTSPIPGTEGSSNEKKYIFKVWKGLIGSRKEGYPPYSWKGWIRVPRGHQRMAANDLLQITLQSTGVNALFCHKFVYKWYK